MKHPAFLASATLVVIAALGLSGCGERTAPETKTATPSATVHQVRGVVRQLPTAGGVPFLVEHEAIPDFVDIRGTVAPMDSMTMPFALADHGLLEGIAVGDTISFELQVDWQTSPAIVIVAIERLPSGTEIDLGDTKPAAGN